MLTAEIPSTDTRSSDYSDIYLFLYFPTGRQDSDPVLTGCPLQSEDSQRC